MTRKAVLLQEKGGSPKDALLHNSDQSYHLQFISPPQNGQFADQDVAIFLRRVFDAAAPLDHDHHRLVQVDGKQAIRVRDYRLKSIKAA